MELKEIKTCNLCKSKSISKGINGYFKCKICNLLFKDSINYDEYNTAYSNEKDNDISYIEYHGERWDKSDFAKIESMEIISTSKNPL